MTASNTAAAPRRVRAGRTSGAVVRLVLVAVVATLLVPLQPPSVIAVPVTLSETLDGLPAADAGPGLAAATMWERSVVVEAPIDFSAIGFTAPAGTQELRLRTSTDGRTWEPWLEVGFLDEYDGPDPGSVEAEQARPGMHSEAVWVAEASYLEVEVAGASPAELEVTLIDSMHLNGGPVERVREPVVGAAADANDLRIVSRAEWGADESLGQPERTETDVHMTVVHHTAHSANTQLANSYTRDQVPGLIRAMHRYHTVNLGWADIGYNLLIDRFGTVYEGRRGGITKGIQGAHARGFNVGSFGVSVIGNFVDSAPPAAAVASLTEVIAFKAAIHGFDPAGWTDQVGDGRWRPTVVGHRDVGQTSCPGRIQGYLPQIREQARVTAVRFPDVPSSSPHRAPILNLAEVGVTRGCQANLFCPEDTLTRAQASSFMVRAFQLDPVPGSRFHDVRIDMTHGPEINVLAELGWLVGYDDGTFRPGERLTRGQLASLLSRTFDGPGDAGSTVEPYPDVRPEMAHHDAIMLLASHGIRGNCDGRGGFCPDTPVKRDSTASFVHMVLSAQGRLPTPEDEDGSAEGTADDDATSPLQGPDEPV